MLLMIVETENTFKNTLTAHMILQITELRAVQYKNNRYSLLFFNHSKSLKCFLVNSVDLPCK